MRKSTKRKLKVFIVDVAMIFLATQLTFVLQEGNKKAGYISSVECSAEPHTYSFSE